MKLKDCVAIVTGGGSGIGRAIATKFSEQGSKLVIVDRKGDLANETVSMIKKPETEAIGIKADVTNFTQVQEMVKTALMTFGKIDILVNNAGWDRFGPFIETTPEFWDTILNLNLKGHIYCSRAVLDHMIERKNGIIINIASDAGRVGFRGEVVYSAAKGGLIAFGKALAKEVGEHGIRINSVAPGPTATPMLQTGIEKNKYVFDEMMLLKKQTPLGRFGTPDEVADLVLFLASNESKFITGQVISINGGLTMSG
jgi:2-hydroxycyclohexanecarboxyl-CoA dehydrogenase